MADQAHSGVPYKERMRLAAKGGTALIWPFIDEMPGKGALELVLDNNALSNTAWLAEHQERLAGRSLTINPWLALVEQWLSNPKFREEPVQRIDGFLKPLEKHGVQFGEGYARVQADLLQRNDAQLRYQFSITFGYVAILKKLMDGPKDTGAQWDHLKELSHADVPRMSACLLLASAVLFFKERQSLRLKDDNATAMSYLSTFFAYQPAQKNEPTYISQAYLRNRGGDLALWYALPMLNMAGVKWMGDPVVVTKDKALYRFIFRLLPAVRGSGGAIQFCPAFDELPEADAWAWHERIAQLNFEFRPPTEDAKLLRLQNLFTFAKACCNQEVEKSELDAAWSEWIEPGIGKDFCP
ncbi:hypothetical protein [Burkholderia cenocepacia]|uniref:hypothetical protein n=1 Tax=Burkholderia cenocepacia TaxID=95486 RepID=UPI002AB7A1AE|nr:hypothetical protein [Burkholderia cenocepacia]